MIKRINFHRSRAVLLMLLMLLPIVSVYCIEFINGNGEDVSAGMNIDRERPFYYHNNTDDQHWFGTTKWAVRFDFPGAYPGSTNVRFAVQKLQIYFPTVPVQPVPVTVDLYSEVNNLPGTLLFTSTRNIDSNIMEFINPEQDTIGIAWMVVSCNAMVSGPYISASIGGGSHSFFWNTSAPVPYYQNLYSAGINSEFLFSAFGSFVFNDFDIELNSFEMKPLFGPGSRVFPEFTIYNNSNRVLRNPSIELTITSANDDDTTYPLIDNIIIFNEISPYDELTVLYDNPEYQGYGLLLPDYPTQLKFKATLHSEHDADEIAGNLPNNTKTRYYNSFNRTIPVKLVENFISSGQTLSLNMLQTQQNYTDDTFKTINYYTQITEPYYSAGSVQRYNWYNFMGIPMSVVGGDFILTGYIQSIYADRFASAVNDINQQKSFIRQSEISDPAPLHNNSLPVKVSLRNPDTYVFSGGINPSPIAQSRFYAALCKKTAVFGVDSYVFSRWGAYQATIDSLLEIGGSWEKQFTLNVTDINTDSLYALYDIVYWIQNNTTREIIYANVIPVSQLVGNEDETISEVPVRLILAPNPVRLGRDLHLTVPQRNKDNNISYAIYNCKGQLIKSGFVPTKDEEAIIPAHIIKAAGIYLVRLSYADPSRKGRTISQTSKIMFY